MPLTNYIKTSWVNGGTPAINSTNLNKIETQLFDLTEEVITPNEDTTATVTQEITTLPVYAKGTLDSTLRGNTEVNVVKNGNFASTTSWTAIGSTLSASSNTLSVTGTGSINAPRTAQSTSILCVSGNKVYVRALIRVTNSSSTQINLRIYGSTVTGTVSEIFVATPVINTWYLLSGVLTINSNNEGLVVINPMHSYADSATANGKVMEVKEVMAIDLTSRYGAGNEPTTAQANLIYPNWFDDVKSTNRQIVKSVGKNLFDGTIVGLSGEVEATQLSYSSFTIKGIAGNAIGSHNLLPNIKWQNNTRYTFSGIFFEDNDTKNTRLTIIYTDNTVLQFASPTTTPTFFSITSLANKTIKIISYAYSSGLGTTTYQNFQIEQGTTATTYEEYAESTAIMPTELKKISSTIYDTYDANSGQHTKNVSDWVTLSGNAFAWGYSGDGIGYKIIQTSKFNDSVINSSTSTKVIKSNLSQLSEYFNSSQYGGNKYSYNTNVSASLTIGVFDAETGWDEAWVSGTSFTGMTWANLIKAYMNGWKLTTANTNVASCVWTGIASGTTQSGSGGYSHVIANIDVGYTPYRMIYQLATPVITNYYANVLNANPSGTVYVYPAITDYDFYSNGAFITNTTYLIDTLEYVNKVDKVTGALTPIALSTCTINANKLSFTSTALSSGDLVDYRYTYKDLTTLPDLTYTYSTNLKSQVNSNTNEINNLDNKVNFISNNLNITLNKKINDLKFALQLGGI